VGAAYVDTSCLVAIAFGERGARATARRLSSFGDLVASNLLEAELRSAFLREQATGVEDLLESIRWVSPERPLSAEISRVLAAGYLRGADCWHLATALYLSPNPAELAFVTLDARQGAVAVSLGFGSK
jgi:predicted nucleic acid-binding protein